MSRSEFHSHTICTSDDINLPLLRTLDMDKENETLNSYYSPVRLGRYDRESEAYVFQYDENHSAFVSAKKVARVVQRLKEGHNHITACPVHGMSREDAAYMLANADEILKEINK